MATTLAPRPAASLRTLERPQVMRLLAGAFFYDIQSARVLADYFVSKHMDLRCKASDVMDDLARAILFAPFDLTLVTFHGLATPTSSAMTQVTMLTIFVGHTLAVPFEFLVENQLVDLCEALAHLIDPKNNYYSQARYGHTRGEIVLECFNGRRDLAECAWPPLLLTLCYRAFARMLNMAVSSKAIDASFAHTLLQSGTTCLRDVVQRPADVAFGRLDALKCVSRDVLLQQLARLHATIEGSTDFLVLQRQLEKLAVHFTGYCAPVDMDTVDK